MARGVKIPGGRLIVVAAAAAAIAAPALADEFKFPEADEYDGPGLFSGDDGVFSFSLNRKGDLDWEDSGPEGAKPWSGGSYMPPASGSGGADGNSGAQGGYVPPASYQGGALSYPGQPAPVFQQPYPQPVYQAPAYQQQPQQPYGYGQPVYRPPASRQPYRPPAYARPAPQQPQAQGGGGASPATGE